MFVAKYTIVEFFRGGGLLAIRHPDYPAVPEVLPGGEHR